MKNAPLPKGMALIVKEKVIKVSIYPFPYFNTKGYRKTREKLS